MFAVYKEFGAGKYESAMRIAEQTLPEYERIGGDEEIFALQLYTDFCLRAYDANCASKYLVKSSKIISKKIAETSGAEKQKFFTHLISDMEKSVRLSYMTGDYETVKKLIDPLESLLANMVVLDNPFAYVEARLSLAYWYLKDGKKEAASESVEKAWLNFLTLKKIYEPDLIKYGTHFSTLFTQLGQSKRAVYVAQILRPLVIKSGSFNQYDTLRFALLNRNVGIFENNPQVAVGSMLYALEILKNIELAESHKKFFDTTIKLTVLIDCFSVNTDLCKDKDVFYQELKRTLHEEKGGNKLPDLQRFSIGLALALDDLSRSEKSDVAVLEALKTKIEKPIWDDGSTISYEAMLKLSKFLTDVADQNLELASDSIIEAAMIEVKRLKNTELVNPLDVHMLNSHQRTIFSIANTFIVKKGLLSPEKRAYLFDSMNLVNTSIRNVESKYLMLLSSENDKKNQGALQSYHRLKQDSELLERRILSERVNSRLTGTQWDGAVGLVDTKQLVRLNKVRHDIRNFDKSKWKRQALSVENQLNDFQSTLRDTEAYVTYQVVESNLLLLCVGKNDFVTGVGLLNPTTAIDIKLLQAALSNPSPPSKEVDESFPVDSAQRLSSSLLEPIKSCFKGKSHIFFAQDENLSGLSHHVLIDPNAKTLGSQSNSNLLNVPWLGLRYSISLLTGPDHLIATRKLPTPMVASYEFLGIGNPLLSGSTVDGQLRGRSVLRGVSNSMSVKDLDELPDTATELKSVASSFGRKTKLILGAQATEVAVRRLPLREFDVIEFATHGLVRDEISGLAEPALVLTPNNSKLEIDDGLLTATDISRMDLNASLVILSACNSARFNLNVFSSETASLSTAFFLAGAKSTMASLWSVNSEATNKLVSRFALEYARNKNDAARALQLSMISMQKTIEKGSHFSHPRYWSSFVLYGDSAVKAHGQFKAGQALQLRPSMEMLEEKGHIQSAISFNQGFVVAGAKPDSKSLKYFGFVIGVDASNKVKWEIADSAYFFGVVASSASAKSVLVLAYPINFEAADSYKILKINEFGKVERTIKIKREINEVAHKAELLPDGKTLIFAASVLSNDDYINSFEIRVLDVRSGEVVKRKIGSNSKLNYPSLSLNVMADNSIAIFFSGTSYKDKTTQTITDTGMIQPCMAMGQTEMIFMNLKLEEIHARKSYQNINISKLNQLRSGQSIVTFTELDRCTLRNIRSGVAKFDMNSGALDPIFLDLTSYDARLSRITEVGDTVVLSGYVSRKFDNSAVESKIGSVESKVTQSYLSEDPDTQTGIVVVQLDPKSFTFKAMDLLFNGLDVYANDVVSSGSRKLQFFGNSSDRQFSATLTVP